MALIWLKYGSYMAYLTIGGPGYDRCGRFCSDIYLPLIVK